MVKAGRLLSGVPHSVFLMGGTTTPPISSLFIVHTRHFDVCFVFICHESVDGFVYRCYNKISWRFSRLGEWRVSLHTPNKRKEFMRIYVKISDKMGEKLDHYASDFGMSKSAFIAYALGKHINDLDHQAQTYQQVGDTLSNLMGNKLSEKGESLTDEYFNN